MSKFWIQRTTGSQEFSWFSFPILSSVHILYFSVIYKPNHVWWETSSAPVLMCCVIIFSHFCWKTIFVVPIWQSGSVSWWVHQHQRPTHSLDCATSLWVLAVDKQETRATLVQRRQMKKRKRTELSSLLHRLIRSNSINNTNQVENLQQDPNSSLHSVKSCEESTPWASSIHPKYKRTRCLWCLLRPCRT